MSKKNIKTHAVSKRLSSKRSFFWIEAKSEFKKVVWPSRKVAAKSVSLVLVCVFVSIALISAFDFALSKFVVLL
ncbi:preprotein translocase subunit SecE [bacterium]|jgi:preprotein translocase SecE subunit|nr:preprotein translocase subunit SecE [bacterium]|tara:strand:+ start:5317 stop:5538 length:222 start_codon:yes stop_codon:yes gene_type:complete